MQLCRPPLLRRWENQRMLSSFFSFPLPGRWNTGTKSRVWIVIVTI